jgi:hypothetical protein
MLTIKSKKGGLDQEPYAVVRPNGEKYFSHGQSGLKLLKYTSLALIARVALRAKPFSNYDLGQVTSRFALGEVTPDTRG